MHYMQTFRYLQIYRFVKIINLYLCINIHILSTVYIEAMFIYCLCFSIKTVLLLQLTILSLSLKNDGSISP